MKYLIAAGVVVAIIILIRRVRGCGLSGCCSLGTGSSIPLLRQFGDLRASDFQNYPVWVSCHVIDYDEPWHDDTDEETFRPWDKDLPVDPAETIFLVQAPLTLADGTEMLGFIAPQTAAKSGEKPDLASIQPHMFLPDGTVVGFWSGMRALPPKEVSRFYAAIGRSQPGVFPIAFAARADLTIGIASGSVPGFCSVSAKGKIEVAV